MPAQDLALRLLISAKDGASGVLSALTGTFARLAAAAAAFFGARAAAAFFADMTTQAGELQRQLSILQQVTNALPADLAELRAAADAVGASGASVLGAVAAQIELGKAGQSTKEIIASLIPTLDLANAAQLGVSESAAIMTRTLAGFGLGAQHAAQVANTLVAGANASNTSVQGLAEALSYAGPMASAAGYGLDQMVAAIGAMANRGVDASRAGTALNSILSQLADPASTASAALGDMGISTRDLFEVLGELAQGGPAANRAILAFGMEAGPALRSLIAQGASGIEALRQQVAGTGDDAAKAAAAIQDNLPGALASLGSTWETIKTRLGEGLLGPVQREVKALTAQLTGWLASGQLEKLRADLVTVFESAAGAVRKFVGDFDLGALLKKAGDFAKDSAAIFDAYAAKLKTVGDVTSRVVGAMGVLWNGSAVVLNGIAQTYNGLAANVMGAYARLLEGGAKLGLADKKTAEDARKSADEYRKAWEDAGKRVDASYDATGAAAAAMVGFQTETEIAAAKAAAAAAEAGAKGSEAAKQQAAAISLTADQLDAMGEGYSQAADGAMSHTNAAAANATAQAQAAAAMAAATAALDAEAQAAARGEAATLQWNAATGQWVTAGQQQMTAALALTAAVSQGTTASAAAASAKEQEAKRAAELARVLAQEIEARRQLIAQQQAEQAILQGTTSLLERQTAARLAHLQNLQAEAVARGDQQEAQRLAKELTDAERAGAVALVAAKEAEAAAAAAVAKSLAEQAQAQGDVSQTTRQAIAAAEQAAAAKRLEADAAAEVVRHEKALKTAKEESTAATAADTAATGANAAARATAATTTAATTTATRSAAAAAGTDNRLNDAWVERRATQRTTMSPPAETAGVGGAGWGGRAAAAAGGAGSGSPAPIVINVSVQGQDSVRLAASARGARVGGSA